MIVKLKLFNAETGDFLGEFADEAVKPGINTNGVIKLPIAEFDTYVKFVSCDIVTASQVNATNNEQLLFVLLNEKETEIEPNTKYFFNAFEKIISDINTIKQEINALPDNAKTKVNTILPFFNQLTKKVGDLGLLLNYPKADTIEIKQGDIISIESVSADKSEKSVCVALVDKYNPINKNISLAISVVIMHRNELINTDDADGRLAYGMSFQITKRELIRKPTEDEIQIFFEVFKRY